MSRRPVLIVDPDDGSRTSLASLLRDCGLSVYEAPTGIEGAELARQRVPALVIVDPWPFVPAEAQMVERIRGEHPETQVLVLTTSLRPLLRLKSRLPGIRCLEKPCSPASLLAEVERLLDRTPRGKETQAVTSGVNA